ncbi:amidohydrolase family protein [Mesorhizobium sp. M7D.F.Ca.US.004.03.1.1]|uniref:amidohydrolase family protein n=1 Tax=Mesorhizobium sp. M7D.F.Ca.US.004.03.1.1 TaxID=2496702 RepID=UPI0013E3B90C|nr:amidohydrolase family protein [Mesorhizobium sp. M7D.F.Ca.US.004.03.1.1]
MVGGAGDLVIPGLVNSHHHIGLTPVQLGSPDLPLELWLTHQIRHKVVPPYLDTLYSAFELIASGVTAVQHLGGMKPAPVTDWPSNGSAIVNAYLDIGMRVSFAFCNRDQHRLVYGPDDDFVASLPDGLRERASAFLTRSHFELEDYETLYLRPMLETYGKHPLVRIWLAPINLERASDRLLTLTRDWAERHGIGIHLHLSETPYQKEFSQRRFGKSSLAHLEDIGILGPHLTVGHGTWICESDLDIVARHGVCVCHNASSNLRLRSGIAPVLEFLKRGIPVAMGIDEAGLNDDRDMLQEMRLIKHIHAKPGLYEKTVTPAEIFKMATEHGARATGFGDVIGTIEVGKRADLVVLDYARITEPYFEPGRAPVDALVYRAKAEHVKLTMIDGNVVYRDGKFAFVDRAETFAKIKADLERPRTETEELRASFSNDIFPHVKDFYLDWTLPEANPWYVLNGR